MLLKTEKSFWNLYQWMEIWLWFTRTAQLWRVGGFCFCCWFVRRHSNWIMQNSVVGCHRFDHSVIRYGRFDQLQQKCFTFIIDTIQLDLNWIVSHLPWWMFPNSNRSLRIRDNEAVVAYFGSSKWSISAVQSAPHTIWPCCKHIWTFSRSIRWPLFPHSNIRRDLKNLS